MDEFLKHRHTDTKSQKSVDFGLLGPCLPGGPNDTQKVITDIEQHIEYPCYHIRTIQSLKDKQLNEMYK